MADYHSNMKTDAGIEVHQHFNFYLPGSKNTSQMTMGQKAVGMLYVLRDYAPLTNVVALIFLPIVLLSRSSDDKMIVSSRHQGLLLGGLQTVFLFFYAAQKINLYNLYRHVGIAQVLNFQSNEIWAAPCKLHAIFKSG